MVELDKKLHGSDHLGLAYGLCVLRLILKDHKMHRQIAGASLRVGAVAPYEGAPKISCVFV